jgi:acetoin utilization deacetylase AcuC-like enzyme
MDVRHSAPLSARRDAPYTRSQARSDSIADVRFPEPMPPEWAGRAGLESPQTEDALVVFTDDAMVDHDPGSGHPESPERLASLQRALRERPVDSLGWRAPRKATRADLITVHADAYVDGMLERRGQPLQLDGDTATSEGSMGAALLAVGAAMDAAEAAVSGDHEAAMALVRPPGHHAERRRPMGFCLFNNIAIAAEYARAHLGCERVLIVDWDVHHGNGTQHAFEGRDDVLFFSTHRFPFYPGTGAAREVGHGAGRGYTVNVPMIARGTDGDYALIFEELLRPIAEQFSPDLVLVSAGFDAHRRDPMGGMAVSDEGFAQMMGVVTEVAQQSAEGRLAMVLEGGYDLQALEESVRACLEVAGGATAPEAGLATATGEAALRRAVEVQRAFWSL